MLLGAQKQWEQKEQDREEANPKDFKGVMIGMEYLQSCDQACKPILAYQWSLH